MYTGISESKLFKDFPHLLRIFEIERELETLKLWYCFTPRYWKLVRELKQLRYYGAVFGLNMAIDDLEKAGILKRVNSTQSVKEDGK